MHPRPRTLRPDETARRSTLLRCAGHTGYDIEHQDDDATYPLRAVCSCGHTTDWHPTIDDARRALIDHLHRAALRLDRRAAAHATIRNRSRGSWLR